MNVDMTNEEMAKSRFLEILPTIVGLLEHSEVLYELKRADKRIDWTALVETAMDACGYRPKSPIIIDGAIKDIKE